MPQPEDIRARAEQLQAGQPQHQVEALLGRPNAVFHSSSPGGGRVLWAYQREGLYLYFDDERLVTWRSYPTGCHEMSAPRRQPTRAPREDDDPDATAVA